MGRIPKSVREKVSENGPNFDNYNDDESNNQTFDENNSNYSSNESDDKDENRTRCSSISTTPDSNSHNNINNPHPANFFNTNDHNTASNEANSQVNSNSTNKSESMPDYNDISDEDVIQVGNSKELVEPYGKPNVLCKRHVGSLVEANYNEEKFKYKSHFKLLNSLYLNPQMKASNEDWLSKFLRVATTERVIFDEQNKMILKSEQNLNDSSSVKHILSNLLQVHKPFKNSNIIPTTYFSDIFMNLQRCDSSYQIISSLLNDKIYQIYNEYLKPVNDAFERAQYLIANNITKYLGHDATTKEVWDALVESIPDFVKMVISFAKEVPGLNEIEQEDFTVLVNNRLFDFYIIQNAALFINGESYQILSNRILYSRYWMNKIKGKEKTDLLFDFAEDFNRLNLTNKEKALLVALCFTFQGWIF